MTTTTIIMMLPILAGILYCTYTTIDSKIIRYVIYINLYLVHISLLGMYFEVNTGFINLDYLLSFNLIILILAFIIDITLIDLNRVEHKLLDIYDIKHNDRGRYIQFRMENKELLGIYSSVYAMFNTLISDETFQNFGVNKIVFITSICSNIEKSLHHNVRIVNETTFEDYWDVVGKYIIETYGEHGYNVNMINEFIIKVWNADDIVNKHIKVTRDATRNRDIINIDNISIPRRSYHTSQYSRIKTKTHNIKTAPTPFATMDLETIDLDGKQYPIAISCCEGDTSKLFMVDHNLLKTDRNQAVVNMFKKYSDYITRPGYPKTIFIHNLGSFDGYFLFKYLLSLTDDIRSVSSLIDKTHMFIKIGFKKIKFKDSYRIFPVSLSSLCKNFGVEGKISSYNPEFNNISLFNSAELLEKFKLYSIQDSVALHQALSVAQRSYFESYLQDITEVHSTSSLSMKIFRKHFIGDRVIPILKHSEDEFIRQSYYGGATDYYKGYAKNLYYYELTS